MPVARVWRRAVHIHFAPTEGMCVLFSTLCALRRAWREKADVYCYRLAGEREEGKGEPIS